MYMQELCNKNPNEQKDSEAQKVAIKKTKQMFDSRPRRKFPGRQPDRRALPGSECA